MATDIRALPAFFSTDTDFRNWGSGLNAQFTAMGLVQTADTGQINWATVLKPAAADTIQGYEIWRFADSLQATLPVFIKIEYSSGNAADRPTLWFTVGSASSGAGVLTGTNKGTRRAIGPATSKTAGISLNSYCSGSTSRLCLFSNVDTAGSFGMTAIIERPKTSAGADTADGIVTAFGYYINTGQNFYQCLPPPGGTPPSGVTTIPFMPLGRGAFTVAGTNVALVPHLVIMGKVLFGSTLSYVPVDIGALTSFTATHLGATRTFMPFGAALQNQSSWNSGGDSNSIAMLWE